MFVQKGSHSRYNRNYYNTKGSCRPGKDEDANNHAAEKDKKKNNACTKGNPKSPDDNDDDDRESSPEKEEARHKSTHVQFLSLASHQQHFHNDEDDDVGGTGFD